MNNVIPDAIFDKTGEVIDAIADHRKDADKAWAKAARAYKKSEYAPELGSAVEAAGELHHRLGTLQALLQDAVSLAIRFHDITDDPTGDLTALATEYVDLMTRITEAVAKTHDAIDK